LSHRSRRDPVTGKRRQVSWIFRGNLRDAKKARAALLVEVGKGRHTGSRATLDDLFAEWIIELGRKGGRARLGELPRPV